MQIQIRMLLKEKSKQVCFNFLVAVPCGKLSLLGFLKKRQFRNVLATPGGLRMLARHSKIGFSDCCIGFS